MAKICAAVIKAKEDMLTRVKVNHKMIIFVVLTNPFETTLKNYQERTRAF